jgi:hypothetical protein
MTALSAKASRLGLQQIGDVPHRSVSDLIRTIVCDVPLTPAADRLLQQACTTDGRERLDAAVTRLVPQMLGTRAFGNLDADRRGYIRATAMRLMVRFAALEQQAAAVSEALLANGITPLFLKGFPLAAGVYPRPSDRPMGDLDIAVQRQDFERAVEVLDLLGLIADHRDVSIRMGVNEHALPLRDPNGMTVIDLHHNILDDSLWQGADDGFWQRARPFPLSGSTGRLSGALTLAPEDHLLHACLHGYSRVRSHSVFRWITDSIAVLRLAGDGFRWDTVVEEADRQRCGPVLAASLAYLVEEFDVPVPVSVITALTRGKAHYYDVGYFRASTRMSHSASLWRRFVLVWMTSQRQMNRAMWSPLSVGSFLAWRWGCDSVVDVPGEFLRRARDGRRRWEARVKRPPLLRLR